MTVVQLDLYIRKSRLLLCSYNLVSRTVAGKKQAELSDAEYAWALKLLRGWHDEVAPTKPRGAKKWIGLELGYAADEASQQVEGKLNEKNPKRIGRDFAKRLYEARLGRKREDLCREHGWPLLPGEEPSNGDRSGPDVRFVIPSGAEFVFEVAEKHGFGIADARRAVHEVAAMGGRVDEETVLGILRRDVAPTTTDTTDDFSGGLATVTRLNPRKPRGKK